MADHDSNVKPDDPGALAERLMARRAQQANGHREASAPLPSPPASHMREHDPSDGMADRLLARRAKQGQGESQGGDGEGNLGKEIAREPLFVGLGIRGHHHAGQKDSEAPSVKPADASASGFEDLGAPDPQPTRSRRHRM